MRVSVTFSQRDLAKVNLLVMLRTRSLYIAHIFYGIALMAFMAFVSEFPESTRDWIILISVSTVATIILFVFSVGHALTRTLRTAKATPGTFDTHEYDVSPEGVRETTTLNNAFTKWAGITDVFVAGRYLILRQGPINAHIILQESFPHPEDFEKFAEDAKSFWNRNK